MTGLKLKSKAEKLQFSEVLNRNQKPQALIGDILLHTKQNYKRGKPRLASLGANDGVKPSLQKHHTLEMSDVDSSFVNKSGHFHTALKSSLVRIDNQRNMNRTTMTFINRSEFSQQRNEDLMSIASNLIGHGKADRMGDKAKAQLAVYQSVSVPTSDMKGKHMYIPNTSRSPRNGRVTAEQLKESVKIAQKLDVRRSTHAKGLVVATNAGQSKNSTFASSM